MKTAGLVAILAGLFAAPAATQTDSEFIQSVLSARIIELNFVWDRNAPILPFNPPFTMALHSSHEDTAGMLPGGMAFAAELMVFSGHHGAPTIDALGHISKNGKLYGGLDAAANEGSAGLKALGIETYPKEKFVNRGVLLDVARYKGVDALEPGYVITAADLEETAKAQGVAIRSGDSLILHTGHARFYGTDREKYMGPSPGVGPESVDWLIGKDPFLVGADNISVDSGPPFAAHLNLIAGHGVYLVENMNLEELAAVLAERGTHEFLLVLNPLRLGGATASPLNAFAILP